MPFDRLAMKTEYIKGRKNAIIYCTEDLHEADD